MPDVSDLLQESTGQMEFFRFDYSCISEIHVFLIAKTKTELCMFSVSSKVSDMFSLKVWCQK